MIIDFACPECQLSFKVNSKLAGRKGRCKRCGHRMIIPSAAAEDVARSGMFRIGDQAASGAGSLSHSMQLAPISEDIQRAIPKKEETKFVEPEVTSYKLAPISAPTPTKKVAANTHKPASAALRKYQKSIRNLSGLVRRIGELAYLATIPCVLVFLLGIVLKKWNLVIAGATGICLLSGGRLLVSVIRMAIIPFGKSPRDGILFLIPPITFYYIYKNWPAMRSVAATLVGPILLLICLFLAFEFVPYLAREHQHGDQSVPGQIEQKIDAASDTLKGAMKSR